MRLRYWTALTVIVCVAIGVKMRGDGPEQAPEIVTEAALPELQDGDAPLAITPENNQGTSGPETDLAEDDQDLEPPGGEAVTWSRAVGPGESLYVLLAEAGLDSAARSEVASAIGSEFDLQSLQPGHRLSLELATSGAPRKAVLEVDDGVRVQAIFGAAPSVRLVPPKLETVSRAGEAEIGSSIYAALDKAGIPTRFATDLELIFAGTLDLRRALDGDEHLRLFWREKRLKERTIGEPLIDFAELDLGEETYEILWPGDESRQTRIYKDGLLVRIFNQPVRGARLSSAFGMRKHPIHGYVRMHSGVDFAAALGSRVRATQSGEITFMGKRSGYGLMVEITHAGGLSTFYAHLSALNEALEVGQRIAAGDEIGRVGSTGTSTAPHLHYEVRVEDRPVSPLSDTRLFPQGDAAMDPTETPVLLEDAREELSRLLAHAT